MLVQVAGWLNWRILEVEADGKIVFEVAATGHCNICDRRISDVKATLAAKNIPAEFGRKRDFKYGTCGDEGIFVTLNPPPAGMDVRQYVGLVLNLTIS